MDISQHIFLINEDLKRQIKIFKEKQVENLSPENKEKFLKDFSEVEKTVKMLDNWFTQTLRNI